MIFIEEKTQICQYSTMLIIIDGYNLIRQSLTLRRYERKSLEAGRNALVSRLGDYNQKKGHEIIVVFDAGEGGSEYEERDRYDGIDIIYSSYGHNADEVIKRIVTQSAGEAIVVSSDREIASYAAREGKTSLSAAEFELLMKKAFAPATGQRQVSSRVSAKTGRLKKKKGPSRRLSRSKKQLQKKISRL
ncbi:MAG TPA: hypothetical protein ENN23_02275 [Deltaproteobacteria bacterium]|nr:hypothetical protein [Deltaproteobacteria bacterium]